ncbi:Cof-type HAD-IIB family hydrolase [Virgibacillus sp. MSP4-1]|uniref:HAD family hydrolase n=1 Tax=Virgibacillus sp. MSP4-1 TaxID=2700081 RepID=UPI00039EAA98|nr:HAD family hydrolase [Virgibacillus sp. MSP4-1]QHS23850.1 Cof-type HAD-IIB family hydrolase [Virgibacillus sp. MSP4-1]
MIKLIVSDLDGTLLSYHKGLLERDKEAILHAVGKGTEFSVASGRMDVEIKEVMGMIGATGHRISQNGSFVYSKDEERIYGHVFSKNDVLDLYQFLISTDAPLTIFSENQGFVNDASRIKSVYMSRLFFPIELDTNLINSIQKGLEVSKISVNSHQTEWLKQIQAKIEGQFSSIADSFISDPECLDIMPKAINKGKGVKAIMDAYHLQPEEIMCIGDSYNDISMFQLTPHSYVMSQADEEVKGYAAHEVNYVYEALEALHK